MDRRRMPRPRHIVIVGGGIIGATTAYYLTRHPSFNPLIHHITLLEAATIAAGASGKAGGLLGLWAYPMNIVPLSYRLHAELAAEHDGAERWGYRRLTCGQIAATVKNKGAKSRAKARARASTSRKRSRRREVNLKAVPSTLHSKNGDEDVLHSPLSTLIDTPVTPQDVLSPGISRQEELKDWQKLPKQDNAAAELLCRSVLPQDLDWFDNDFIEEYDEMGLPGYTETAQVHPYQFTTSMAELARLAGVEIRLNAKVTKFGVSKGAVKTVEYVDRATGKLKTILGVTDVVVAAGPWTGRLLPQTKVDGERAHSVVFEADVTPHAVFTNISLPAKWIPPHRKRRIHKGMVDPEVYARPGREVYACGELDDSVPLPETADLVEVDEAQCDDMAAYLGTVSRVLKSAPITAKQACYMPRHMRFGQENTPMIGQTAIDGLFVAAGHTCWGIQNGPATGKLMSELIFDGCATSADISELDPRRFKI